MSDSSTTKMDTVPVWAEAFLAKFRSPDTRRAYRRDLACWIDYCTDCDRHPYEGATTGWRPVGQRRSQRLPVLFEESGDHSLGSRVVVDLDCVAPHDHRFPVAGARIGPTRLDADSRVRPYGVAPSTRPGTKTDRIVDDHIGNRGYIWLVSGDHGEVTHVASGQNLAAAIGGQLVHVDPTRRDVVGGLWTRTFPGDVLACGRCPPHPHRICGESIQGRWIPRRETTGRSTLVRGSRLRGRSSRASDRGRSAAQRTPGSPVGPGSAEGADIW